MQTRGFTLIELSIVLVIIGLIIGGVLVGRDLIAAAAVRAQISQIEKYQAAVNTFRTKYGGLPGDLTNPGSVGFPTTTGIPGYGDGNGVIEGSYCGMSPGCLDNQAPFGEPLLFWVELSDANLIPGGFQYFDQISCVIAYEFPGGNPANTCPNVTIADYLPAAQIGRANFVYVYSGGYDAHGHATVGKNFFGLSAVKLFGSSGGMWPLYSLPGLSVSEALAIDSKVDDGMPQSGGVMAQFVGQWYGFPEPWASGDPGGPAGAPPGGQQAPGEYTCYDNANVSGAQMLYSMSQNSGEGINCGLSFEFQ